MSEQAIVELRARVVELERAMYQVLRHLDGIESALASTGVRVEGMQAPAPPPPPVVAYPAPPRPAPNVAPPIAAPPSDNVAASTAARNDDVEYQIGAKLLPRVGAVMVLLAVLFFVAWRYSQGLIPPWVVFAGEVVFCLAFVAVGIYKRNEREEFGQLLMGIGSSGLYLSLAGGHLVHHLYSAEILVASFLGLSFANLGVSIWRSSKSFLAIGVLGGIAAALMPADRGNYALNVTLHFGIVIPSLAIVWKNRWANSAVAMWIVSTLALFPAVVSKLGWIFGTSILGASTLVCLAVFSTVWESSASQTELAFVPMAVGMTSMVVYGLMPHPAGGLAVVVLSVLVAALVWIPGASAATKKTLALTGVALTIYGAPLFLAHEPSQLTLMTLVVALSAISIVRRLPLLAVLAGIDLALGLGQYIAYASSDSVVLRTETVMLAGSIIAAGVWIVAVRKMAESQERLGANVAGLSVIAVLVVRTIYVLLTVPGSSVALSPEIASLFGFVVVALIAMSIGGAAKDKTLVGIGAVSSAIGFFVVIGMIEDASQGWPEVGCLVGLLASCGLAIATIRRTFPLQPVLEAAYGCLGWVVASRLAYGVPIAMHRQTDPSLTTTVAWISYAVVLIVAGFAWSVQSLRFLSLVVFGATVGKVLLVDMANTDPAIRVGVFLALGLAMLAGGNAYIRRMRRTSTQ